jgi:crotonobetainyl-CoA:carnitine CoA-transferase CaiB-like acyl-CoA transferase
MLPLAGVKVVEIAQNLAGPFAAEILAHMGADVVKVERPDGGDDARGWGPPFFAGTSAAYHAMNVNKRAITVDLKDPAAVSWLTDHIAGADVLVQNLRPGVTDELGLGAEAMLARHPRLIYCSLWAFGNAGPLRLRPGYEPMVQAFAGLFMLSGEEGGPPIRLGTSVLDFGTGMWAAMGVLAGLVQRARTGRGCVVDTSLFETALGWLTGHFASYRISGDPPVRHPTGSSRLVVFQGFQTKSGPIIIAAGNDRLFAKLAAVLGRPEWATDARFATNAQRNANREALIPEIETIMLTRTKGEWLDRLEEAGVPCAPIHTLPEVLAQPQTAATGMIQKVPGLDLELMSLPIRFDGVRPPIRRHAPTLGEHNDEILGAPRKGTRSGASAPGAPRP